MDVELREALTQGFGPEPAHRPVTDRLDAGHRAVRRRRIAGSVVAVAVATVAGLGAVAVLDDGAERPGTQVAADPSADWEGGELARYDAKGNLEIRPDATVVERVDSPYPPSAGMDHSVALDLEYQGEESWLLMTWTQYDDGSVSESGAGASGSSGDFRDWVAQQVRRNMTPTPEDNSAGYLHFAADGSLVATHGNEILAQVVDPDLPAGFAPDGARTAAALLKHPDGKRFYVLVWETDGAAETEAVPFKMGGPDLEAFIAYASEKYLSGEEVS